ncbi:hypothetical protein PG990_012685 [Apiospora arundinis]
MAQPDDDLKDDLQMQEILLESLYGTPEDTPQRRAEIKAEIDRVKTELKRLQVARQNQGSAQHADTALYRAGSVNTMAGSSRDEPPDSHWNFNSPYAYGDRPDDSSISGVSFHGRNLWDQASNNESARKRTYSTHLDNGRPTLPGPKSQRTEESEWETELFGDNGNVGNVGDFGDFGDINNTGGEDEDNLARRSEYEQRELAYRQKLTQEEKDAALARRLQDEEEGLQESLLHDNLSDSSEPNGHQFDHDQSRPIDPPAPSEPRANRMPGSWEAAGFNDVIDLTDDQPIHGFVPARNVSASSAGNVHPGELARHAEIQRQRLGNGSPFPGSLPGNSAPYHQRPGSLVNGAASHFANRANPSVYRPGTSSLADIVQRTNNYNYEDGTDDHGDALDRRVIMPAGMDESDQVKALLANIASETGTANSDQDYDSTPPALKEPLYKHQQLALKWMRGMEADSHKRGGLLADDMGLGKTISMLALMVHDRKPKDDKTRVFLGTNVVVAPVSLIRQWEKEIQDKLKHTYCLTVHNYHKKKLPYNELCKFDVVLTSYGKLGTELKALDAFTKDRVDRKLQINKDILAERFPFICAKDPFLRLVLDESQQIKNKNTQMHRAVCRISSKYRWCLSGTPMMNNVDEMGSHIHFLRIRPYDDPQHFKQKFAALYPKNRSYEDPAVVMQRLQVLLRAIMLRRTKLSKIDGAPIISLPPKTEVIDYVTFGPDEQQFYNDLARDAQVQFSKFLAAGTVGKHYSYILVQLLRLRQACCHPHLLLMDLEFTNADDSGKDMAALAREINPSRIKTLAEETPPMECPICYEYYHNPSILVPCGHYACHECLQLHAISSEQRNQMDREGAKPKCILCRADFDMKKTITYEAFKSTFIPKSAGDDNSEDEADDDSDSDSDSGSDADLDSDETNSAEEEDGDDIDESGNLKNFIDDDDDADDYKPRPKPRKARSKSKDKGKKKDKRKKKKEKKKEEEEVQPHMLAKLRKDATRNMNERTRYLNYLKSIWEPSAKITKCIEVLRDIQESGEKTIVFSQWTLLLDLLEVPLKHDLNIRFRRYDGGMSAKARDEAVHEFADDDGCKVMLTSLKAGNAGLNLICASRVIILDPFWNPFIEKQAVDRTYRIGQRRPVKVHRILIKDTVEDRIVQLQEQKRELVEGAMDEQVAKNLGRLSHNDLAYIFGVNRRS